jgi:GntP family gluconate:H+ symporter
MLVLPVALIVTATVADMTNSPGRNITTLFGHPFTALLVTALLCMYVFGIRRGLDRNAVTRLATDALLPIGTLLAIMGGGGAFKQVIVDSGVGTYAGKMLVTWHVSPLILAYVVAAVLRGAQGSATVAIITAAGIVAPLVKSIPGYSPEMILMALCCGGTALSHVNDAGFWLVKESLGMTVPQTLRTWTAMKMVTSVTGIAIVLLIQSLV